MTCDIAVVPKLLQQLRKSKNYDTQEPDSNLNMVVEKQETNNLKPATCGRSTWVAEGFACFLSLHLGEPIPLKVNPEGMSMTLHLSCT